MNCPYKDSLVPRCDIATHPDRPNVEYCRVCREWDYISHIGNEFSLGVEFRNVLWFVLAVGLVLMILHGIQRPLMPEDSFPQTEYSNQMAN